MNKRTKLSTISSSLVWVSLSLLIQSCDKGSSIKEIAPGRSEALPEKSHVGGADSATRFGFRAKTESPQSNQGQPIPAFDLPAGWSELPPRPFRVVNLQVAGHEDATCHLTPLSGDGGGLLANVNRWRSQIGLPGIGEADLARLPTHKFFNSRAVFLDLAGTYAGMGQSGAKEDWGLMGLLLVSNQASLFLKMQGPAAVLQKEKKHFLDLAASFHWKAGGGTENPHGAAASGTGQATSQPSAAASAGGLRYDKPGAWTSKPGSQYRLINFAVGKGGLTECYVSQSGGGLQPNFDRWCGQMGHKPVSTSALKESLSILGVQTPLLEIEGSFQGMRGPRIDKAGMLAAYVEAQGTSYAIKLTGPIEEVRAAKKDFVNFVQSLRTR